MADFAKLHRDVLFEQSSDQIIWQPRILCWYTDKKFTGEQLPPPYTNKSLSDIYRALGCSDRLYGFYNGCFQRIEHPSVKFVEQPLNETDTLTTIETPVGNQTEVIRRPPSSDYLIHIKWEVETEEELKVATWREENTTWTWDQKKFEDSQKKVGDLGAPTMFFPRMNVQSLYIEKMGIENGVFAIYDWPDTTEAYFSALEDSHFRLIEIVNTSPVEIINFGENIHSGTLSPSLFVKYHLPACQRRCEKLHAAGKFISSHWDGDCKPLIQYAKETGLDGIEAITPVPQGDVTLEEIKAALGDAMFLLDGIPAVYFDERYPIEILKECAHKVIELFAPRLVLGISDEMSSTGNIERIHIVGDIVEEYNAKFC